MSYSAQAISSVIAPGTNLAQPDANIVYLLTDSRRLVYPASSLFFALPGGAADALHFVQPLYAAGVRNFVVPVVPAGTFPDANLFVVADVLAALQAIAAHHRKSFTIPVIGITGSNGKTIVKEWLFQVLHEDRSIVRSPKSYNSQVGVALSLWQMDAHHDLAIIEAGISLPGEMDRLREMIRPTMGVLTNIGAAHSEGFGSDSQKLAEKWKLFSGCPVVIGRSEEMIAVPGGVEVFSWGKGANTDIMFLHAAPSRLGTDIHLRFRGAPLTIAVPFTDEASIANAITCICVLVRLGVDLATICERMARLHPVDMRLQLLHGINRSLLLNDSYSADTTSLHIALHFLVQQGGSRRAVAILSDFAESGKTNEALYAGIAADLLKNGITEIVAIGSRITAHIGNYLPNGMPLYLFPTTEDFLAGFRPSLFSDRAILIKGGRRFGFERIARLFEMKVHQTVLQVNLSALAHNLGAFRRMIPAGTRVMAMVKAFSYGSGGFEIAGMLQFANVDYLGVAYADEGIELRKAGILTPVMVLNSDEASFPALIEYNLQPVVYSMALLEQLHRYLEAQGVAQFPIHLEMETGMNRLGFSAHEIERLALLLTTRALVRVQSVFSHLAASDNPDFDTFTRAQAATFEDLADRLQEALPYPFLKHIANSAAILRHPALILDMVRLGIGLYGIESVERGLRLQPVATLRSTIAQLKHIEAGESVSYNRSGRVDSSSLIATVRIGYADGYPRRLGNGLGKMWVRGHLVPVIGNVCMDMTMLDVTGIKGVAEGDDVVVFGPELPLQQVAKWAETIPYEIMTGVSARVKRVYFQE